MNKKLLFFLPLFIFISWSCEMEEYEFLQESKLLTLTSADFAYTVYDRPTTNYNKRSALAITKINTDATFLSVSFYAPITTLRPDLVVDAQIAVFDKNWNLIGAILPDVSDALQTKTIALNGIEGVRDFYLVEGGSARVPTDNTDFLGCYIQTIEAVDGTIGKRTIPKSSNRIYSVGGSNSVGDGATINGAYGWSAVLRDLSRLNDWSVTTDAWGSAFTNGIVETEDLQQAMANRMAIEFAGATGRKVILWSLGTNDFGFNIDPATMKNKALATWDKAKALIPDVEVFILTPIYRGDKDEPNRGGWILRDYHDAFVEIAGLRTWVTAYDGMPILDPATDLSDPLHSNDQGHQKIAKFINNSL